MVSPCRGIEGDQNILVAPSSLILRLVTPYNGATCDQKGLFVPYNGAARDHKVLVSMWA
jgi:hypothetical protein